MMERLCRSPTISFARERTARCADMVFCGTSNKRASSPAGTPSGSRATNSRNVSSRVDWASAAKAATTSISSIHPEYQIYGSLQVHFGVLRLLHLYKRDLDVNCGLRVMQERATLLVILYYCVYRNIEVRKIMLLSEFASPALIHTAARIVTAACDELVPEGKAGTAPRQGRRSPIARLRRDSHSAAQRSAATTSCR